METASTDLVQKVPTNYFCKLCDYNTSRVSQYNRHLTTAKHIKRHKSTHINSSELKVLNQLSGHSDNKYMCNNCKREYKDRSGLWKHNKTCIALTNNLEIQNTEEIIDEPQEKDKVIEILIKENTDFKNIILEFMKSSSDMQKQLIDVCKNSNNTIISQNNSHNKTFNLQFFLNEQCKDAMNLSEFANSFDLQLSDLEIVGELGYVEGITKIMVDKLNSMDVYKRPIHCSDAKREIIYVKEENVWTKEEKDNPKLRQAIKNISFRNMKLVYNWSNAYPESKDNQSKLNDKYMHLVIESTGGKGPIMESENKIIRRIAKEILIDKM
jgi:hypothetical protein